MNNCPFCKSNKVEPVVNQLETETGWGPIQLIAYVLCMECHACGPTVHMFANPDWKDNYQTKFRKEIEEAISLWNNRGSIPKKELSPDYVLSRSGTFTIDGTIKDKYIESDRNGIKKCILSLEIAKNTRRFLNEVEFINTKKFITQTEAFKIGDKIEVEVCVNGAWIHMLKPPKKVN